MDEVRVSVLDVMIDMVTMKEAVAMIEDFIVQRQPRLVATANAEMVMNANEDAELKEILAAADLVVPDGAGVVWAARHQGHPMQERVAGYDLAQALLAQAAVKGYKVYFFGGAPGIAEAATRVAGEKYPGLNVVGIRNGFFSPQDDSTIVEEIRSARPDILLAALGVPKQEKWLFAHMKELEVPVSMGVGGSFDVMAGVVCRAPVWMQRAGLEWLYRLACQPQRFMRMLALPRFAIAVLRGKKH